MHDVEGKKLFWNLRVNGSEVTVKLMWIKAENPTDTHWKGTQPDP